MYKPKNVLYLFIILLSTNFFACKDDFENYSVNAQDHLSFSIDTLSFDTILTTVNSPALAFRVYNKNAKPLLISSIQLASGATGDFKINVDGMAGSVFENVEILAKDSLLVLVNVKPKENGQYTPTLFNDYVLFETNGVQQKVVLQAFGQDVYVYRGVVLSKDSVLDSQKPYLIYDSLVIDKDATVEIREGSVFYMSSNAQLIVNGTIKIKGTREKPVIFRGSRTDYVATIPYDLIPGQWGGIRFASESYGNEMENVRIRNGKYGMDIKCAGDLSRNKLTMRNVVLTNVTGNLLQAINCNLIAENCELTNSKDTLLYIVGGSCRFTHCTIANCYPSNQLIGLGNSNYKTLILADYIFNWNTEAFENYPVINAEFYNTIIWGNSSMSPIQITGNDSIPYLFQNCLLPNEATKDSKVIDCIFQVDPLFKKINPFESEKNPWYPSFDFSLQKTSPAIGAANLKIAGQIPYDLYGFYRLTDGKPDLGAYEYHEKE